MPRTRVFISSHMIEFAAERDEIAELLTTLQMEPIRFEKFGARTETPEAAFLEELDTCPIYLGIFGDKYSGATWKEFERALKRGKDILMFVKETEIRGPELQQALNRISSKVVYEKFKDQEDLVENVRSSLLMLLTRNYERFKSMQPVTTTSIDLDGLDSHFEAYDRPYRRVAVYPTATNGPLIEFTRELDIWLRSIEPPQLLLGDAVPRPHGVEFGYTSKSGSDSYGKLSDRGLVYYGEVVDEKGGFHIGRNTVVLGQVLRFASRFYSKMNYSGLLNTSLKVGKARGLLLVSDPRDLFRVNYTLDEHDVALVERQVRTNDLSDNTNQVIASLTRELWRWFKFAVEDDQILKHHVRKLDEYWMHV